MLGAGKYIIELACSMNFVARETLEQANSMLTMYQCTNLAIDVFGGSKFYVWTSEILTGKVVSKAKVFLYRTFAQCCLSTTR